MDILANGRINILTHDKNNTMFKIHDTIPISSKKEDYRDSMIGNWYNTALSDAFFSKENIQIIQNGIRKGVFELSNKQFIICEQNEDELKIIMRSIFLQYSKNLKNNIKYQIQNLNKLVLDYAINQVYSETVGYIKYKYDISTMYDPISRPVLSRTNDKQLELKKWF
jgi:hypothetical protein